MYLPSISSRADSVHISIVLFYTLFFWISLKYQWSTFLLFSQVFFFCYGLWFELLLWDISSLPQLEQSPFVADRVPMWPSREHMPIMSQTPVVWVLRPIKFGFFFIGIMFWIRSWLISVLLSQMWPVILTINRTLMTSRTTITRKQSGRKATLWTF